MADTFSFASSGLDPDVFRVLRFTGTEAVSECYSFDLELLALKEFDVKSLYDTDAVFSVSRHDGTSTSYRGRVASVGVERMMDGDFFKCRARLVPHLWFYTLRKSSKAYVGKTISAIIDAELKENGEGASGGFVSQFDQLPQNSFPLVVKYHETPLEFISRLLQRECLYYYFLSNGGMDTLKFSSDAKLKSNEVLSAKVINNLTFSSLGEQDERILFKSVHMEQTMRAEPLNLYAHDGNPDSVETLHGIGRTAIEKSMLGPLRDISNIRQSQDTQPAMRYNMATSVRGTRVGIVHDGLRALSLRHDGDQSAAVLESLGLPTKPDQKDFYRNQGLWMPEGDPYIPQWNLEAPRIANATLTGFTTRINNNGTYDVKCHSIDTLTDLPNVRMVFPFAGKKGEASGMHLPLVDGTEVLLEFLEGDPDRPVIMGSLYNTSVSTPVTAANNIEHILYTPQDNRICLVDGDENTIYIEAQKRIEAFSKSELLEIDSTGNYIRGSATNKIALHANAGKSPDESAQSGTSGTSLVLNGAGKSARLQAFDNNYLQIINNADNIVLDANKTTVELNEEGQKNIALTVNGIRMGELSASSDSILFNSESKSSYLTINGQELSGSGVLIDENSKMVKLRTSPGHYLKVDGGNNYIEQKTRGGAYSLINGKNDILRLQTKNQFPFCLIEGNGSKITLKANDSNYIEIDGGGNTVNIVRGDESDWTTGVAFAGHLGSANYVKLGHTSSTCAALKTDFELSTGIKVGLSKIITFTNKYESVRFKDVKENIKTLKGVLKESTNNIKQNYNGAERRKRILRETACYIQLILQ